MIFNIISYILLRNNKSLLKKIKTYQIENTAIIYNKTYIVISLIRDTFIRIISNHREELYISKYIYICKLLYRRKSWHYFQRT